MDAVSEYVSSTDIFFKGTIGYANFVGGLQTIASSYSKSGYTINTRIIGYGGQTPTIQDTSNFDGSKTVVPSTTSTPSPTTGSGQEYTSSYGGDVGDTLYLKDYQLVSNVYKTDTATYGSTGLKAYKVSTTTTTSYWLASRRYNYHNNDGESCYVHGRFINPDGKLVADHFRRFTGGKWNDNNFATALRPIITLKSKVTISGGAGSFDHPYTLS